MNKRYRNLLNNFAARMGRECPKCGRMETPQEIANCRPIKFGSGRAKKVNFRGNGENEDAAQD